MDETEITRRLDAQDRVLHAILAALAPAEEDATGAGLDDLIELLADLTEAVSDVTVAVRALRWAGSGPPPRVTPSSSGDA